MIDNECELVYDKFDTINCSYVGDVLKGTRI